MTAGTSDRDPTAEQECTCWRVPDAFGGTHPVAWLLLHPSVLVRLRTLRGQDTTVTGRAVNAFWGGPPTARERYLLLIDVGDEPLTEARESQIVWAEPDGRTDGFGLPSTAGRALTASIECASVGGFEGTVPGPATALLQLHGRGFVRVDVRRALHTCVPGDDPFAGDS